ITRMKCEQQQTTRLQHSLHFPKHQGKRFFRNIYDRIESGNSSQRYTFKVKRHHVSFPEGNVRVESSSGFYHLGRKIQPKHGCARVSQVTGYVAGTTAHVTNCATSCYFIGETIEQFPVKRLALKLVENPECILIGNAI